MASITRLPLPRVLQPSPVTRFVGLFPGGRAGRQHVVGAKGILRVDPKSRAGGHLVTRHLSVLLAFCSLGFVTQSEAFAASPQRQVQQTLKAVPCNVSSCKPAIASSSFIDTIGVNVPISNARLFAGMLPLLRDAGIRHVRVGRCANVVQCSFYRNLEKNGIKGTLIEGATETAEELTASLRSDGPLTEGSFVEAIEGINEPNNPGMPWYTPEWASRTRSQQELLWNTVKSNPKTAQISILGPSICCNYSDQQKLGDLSAFLDAGNMHDYFGVLNPGSIFYTGSYVIDYQRQIQAAVSGSKPMISTETGWGTKGAEPTNEVDAAVQQKYVLRGFLEHRLHGVVRVFDFLFVDDVTAGPAYESYGLVAVSHTGVLQPKPSYAAVKSLIAALADDGPTIVPTGLSFAFAGDAASVDHLLLQRRDGSFDLIVWLELPGWDKKRDRATAFPPQQVAIVFSTPIKSASLTRFDPQGSGALARSGLSVINDRVDLQVTDVPEIVHLEPTGTPAIVAVPPVNPGFSLVRNRHSDQCLFVVNASLDPGTAIMQHACSEVRNQQFTVSRQENGSFSFRDANSRNCMKASGTTAGSAIQTADGCASSDVSQQFTLKPSDDKTYEVTARQSGLCLGVPGQSTMAGAQMQGQVCDGSASQKWSIAHTR